MAQYCISYTYKGEKHEVCVPIPDSNHRERYSYVAYSGKQPDLPQLELPSQLQPDSHPWIEDDLLSEETINDLLIIATISKLAKQLSENAREKVLNSLEVASEKIGLPDNAHIDL